MPRRAPGIAPWTCRRSAAISWRFSGHKMCGPTGIGVLYGRQEVLETMPPYQGGGEMILSVEFQKSTWKHAPHRFEAGTPDISGAVGLHAAMDYLDNIGRQRIAQHDQELGAYAYATLSRIKGVRLFGPHIGRAGLVSFLLKTSTPTMWLPSPTSAGSPCAAGTIATSRSCASWASNPRPAPVSTFTTPPTRLIGSPKSWARSEKFFNA